MILSIIQNARKRPRWIAAWALPTAIAAIAVLPTRSARGEPPVIKPAVIKPAVIKPLPASPVVATYDGGSISVADVEDVIAKKIPVSRVPASLPDGRKHVLDEIVDFELLVLEAERRGYAKHPNVVEAMRRQMIESLTEQQLAVDPASVAKADVEAYVAAKQEEKAKADPKAQAAGAAEKKRASKLDPEGEENARQAIAKQRTQAAIDAVLEAQRTAHPVETHPERVNAIELPAAKPAAIPHGFPAAPRDPRRALKQIAPDGI